jgi:Polyketide cyclase / dehydrase and lipid transport
MFPLSTPTDSFVTTASWIFQHDMTIDLPVHDVWNILNDDGAWSHWLPELTKIEWNDATNRGKDSQRTITLKDPLFMILLCGPLRLQEVFDEYEVNKKLSLYMKGANRPNCFTYKCFQEQFILEPINEKQCTLTRILALEPGFLTKYLLGCIIYPYVKHFIE